MNSERERMLERESGRGGYDNGRERNGRGGYDRERNGMRLDWDRPNDRDSHAYSRGPRSADYFEE